MEPSKITEPASLSPLAVNSRIITACDNNMPKSETDDAWLYDNRLVSATEMTNWLTSTMTVLLVVSVILIGCWYKVKPSENNVLFPASAFAIELAPVFAAPESVQDLPIAPKVTQASKPVKTTQETVKTPQLIDIPSTPQVAKPEVVLEKKENVEEINKTPTKEEKLTSEVDQIKQNESAPADTAAPPDAPNINRNLVAANLGLAESLVQASRAPKWRDQLLHALNKAKRYPARARSYRNEGTVLLRFTMDRKGNVLSYNIEKSSSYELLDQATLKMIKAAQPLPAPPDNVIGETLEFVVPVEFFLKRR